jgi:hypothetical protein
MTVTVALDRDYYHLNNEIHDWCVDNLEGASWQLNMMFGHQLYTFDDHSDAALFSMRWGGKAVRD